jgi:ankyrin repeat protein
LTNFGASLKVRDVNNYTPLHYGIMYGKGLSLECLLSLGADPKEEWKQKYRPIHLASQRGSLVSILVSLNHHI